MVQVELNNMYRGADKSLARPTSLCILFDGCSISFDASLVLYRVSQEERTKLREGVTMLNYTDINQNTYVQS